MSDRGFLETVVHPIPGWLDDYTALRTMDLLEFQETSGLGGSLLEIGVFAGRYFSILLNSARRSEAAIVGLDTFQYVKLSDTMQHLQASGLANYDNLKFLIGASSEWSAPRLLPELGQPARFISVDGSHEKGDVFWDLRISEELVSTEGIVALDDFLNPMTLGVNEAVNAFFQQPRNLVPFAYIANKLLLSRPLWADRYKLHLEQISMNDDSEPRSRTFRDNLKNGRHFVEINLFGAKILIWP
jgi:hypothetical protein